MVLAVGAGFRCEVPQSPHVPAGTVVTPQLALSPLPEVLVRSVCFRGADPSRLLTIAC